MIEYKRKKKLTHISETWFQGQMIMMRKRNNKLALSLSSREQKFVETAISQSRMKI